MSRKTSIIQLVLEVGNLKAHFRLYCKACSDVLLDMLGACLAPCFE